MKTPSRREPDYFVGAKTRFKKPSSAHLKDEGLWFRSVNLRGQRCLNINPRERLLADALLPFEDKEEYGIHEYPCDSPTMLLRPGPLIKYVGLKYAGPSLRPIFIGAKEVRGWYASRVKELKAEPAPLVIKALKTTKAAPFVPSQDLINLVRDFYEEKISDLKDEGVAAFLSDEELHQLGQESDEGFKDLINRGVRSSIYNMAILHQQTSGEKCDIALTKAQEFRDLFINQLSQHLPIVWVKAEKFSRILYKDLLPAALSGDVSGVWGRLSLKEDELILEIYAYEAPPPAQRRTAKITMR